MPKGPRSKDPLNTPLAADNEVKTTLVKLTSVKSNSSLSSAILSDLQLSLWTATCSPCTQHHRTSSPVSIQTQSLALRALCKRKPQAANHGCHCFDRAFLLAGACVCYVNASASCVSCGFRLRNARNASDCVWMETWLKSASCHSFTYIRYTTAELLHSSIVHEAAAR